MVKRKTARQKLKEKEAKKTTVLQSKSDGQGEEERGESHPSEISDRLQRKLAKQLRFISKLQETQRILGANKLISKKKKKRKHRDEESGKSLYNLASLAEFLPSLDKKNSNLSTDPSSTIRSSKARRQLVVKETRQLGLILNHPEFKANPYSSIQQHLTSVLGPYTAEGGKSPDKSGNKKKKRQKKIIMGVQDMDRS